MTATSSPKPIPYPIEIAGVRIDGPAAVDAIGPADTSAILVESRSQQIITALCDSQLAFDKAGVRLRGVTIVRHGSAEDGLEAKFPTSQIERVMRQCCERALQAVMVNDRETTMHLLLECLATTLDRKVQWFSARGPDVNQCPAEFVDSLERYCLHGIVPGSFLLAILEGNLERATLHADGRSREIFSDVVMAVIQLVPEDQRGSPEKVAAWKTEATKHGGDQWFVDHERDCFAARRRDCGLDRVESKDAE